jgi:spore coat protein A
MVSCVRQSPHELAEYIDSIENNELEYTDKTKAFEETEICKDAEMDEDLETRIDVKADNANAIGTHNEDTKAHKDIEDYNDTETLKVILDHDNMETLKVIVDYDNAEICKDIEDQDDMETPKDIEDQDDTEMLKDIEDQDDTEMLKVIVDYDDARTDEDTKAYEETEVFKDTKADEDMKTCKDPEVSEETEAFDDSETFENRENFDVEVDYKEENYREENYKEDYKEENYKDAGAFKESVGWEKREEYEMLDPTDPETIPKFVDSLPIPKIARPTRPYDSSNKELFYKITMREAKHKFHRYFPPTTIFGYNGTYPGPTIEVPKDVTVKVKWENKLPKKHLLPVDHTLHGTMDTPDVRTVVHLHGANVAADSDGHPEAWFSRDNEYIGSKYMREVYEYSNHQAGATLWYHDHALGITRLNVYSGLAGFYLIRDYLEDRLNLPKGDYEIPIMIQDKTFHKDGSLFYPDNTTPPIDNPVPSTPSAFFGNTIVVNGKLWPYLEVEPRKYRFRILNASNLRSYTIALSNGEVFHQIGTDQGLLHHVKDIKSFLLEPAERIDLIVDFSKYKGQEIILQNTAQTPPSPGMELIMKFIVGKELKYLDTSAIPKELMPFHQIDPALAVKERTMILDETKDHYGRTLHLLNNRMWSDPVTEKVKLDTIEIWHLVNNFDFPHPIHIHLVQFEILGRKVFTEDDFDEEGNYKFIPENLTPPSDFETGPKDVVRAEPGQVTSIVMHFKEHTGDYVWHCHILEHEDNDMMRPLVIKK